MSQWPHRYHLIIAATDQAAANQVAVEVTGDEADRLTFGVPLSATGTGTATHFGASTAATDPIRVALAVRLGAGRVPSIRYWRIDAATDVLIQSNVAASQARVGQGMSWADALADVGLMAVQSDVI